MNKLLYIVVAASLIPLTNLPTFASAAVATRRSAPSFGDASMIEVVDLRGRLNIFAIADDKSIWRFREPGDERRWLAETVGGSATAISHAVALSNDGLFQVWAVAPNHTISVSYERPGGAGWTSWNRVETSPAQDVAIATQPDRGTLVILRDLDGIIEFGWQKTRDSKLQNVQKIMIPAASRPVLLGIETSEAELVFLAKDRTLRAATLTDSVRPSVQTLQAPMVSGEPSTATLPGGGALLVAHSASGEIFALERNGATWSEVSKPVPPSKPIPGMIKALSVAERKFLVIAQGPQNTLYASVVSEGKWLPWTDTKVPVSTDAVPAISALGRIVYANGKMLSSLTKALAQFSLFTIFADNITPTPTVEGDEVTVAFTLSNHGLDPGTGAITASWNGAKLDAAAPVFTPPLQPGQSFAGSFKMGSFVQSSPGDAHLHLLYKAATVTGVLNEPALGIGPVTFESITQFAEDNETIQVLGFKDTFPTDDPLVQAEPWSCIPTTNDQQHACGSGAGMCSGGNTPDTCPQDCPTPTSEVRSYNSLDLCRQMVGPPLNPVTVADVQSAIHTAAQAGIRVRALGKAGPKHTSNAQICTDGQAIAMEGLRGATPSIATQGDYCSRFDCTADLSSRDPIIESFEGVNTVRVGPGMRLFDLEEFLDQNGLSTGFAVPGFRDPTVGGALATGTHGSSPKYSSVISTRVRSLTMVLADGTIREFSADTTSDTLWKAVRANVGYLGVVVQVRLSVEPAFNLRVKTHWASAKDLLGSGAPISIVSGCDWGEMVWFPSQGRDDGPVMVLCGTKTTDSGDGNNRLLFPAGADDTSKAYPASDLMQRDACAGKPSTEMEAFRSTVLRYYQPAFTQQCDAGLTKVVLDAPAELVPWYAKPLFNNLFNPLTGGLLDLFADCCTSECNVNMVGKGHHMMSSELTPAVTRPFERDWEVFIPGSNAQLAIQTAKSYFQQNGVSLPLIGVFLRFAPAEDGTLIAHTVDQGQFAGNSTGMFFEMPVFLPKGMHCRDQARYEKVYSDLAEKLVSPPINGRAHWGKNRRSLFQLQRRLGVYGDNMTEFRRLVKLSDPNGMFANQFGVDIGLRWPNMTQPVPPNTETLGCTPD